MAGVALLVASGHDVGTSAAGIAYALGAGAAYATYVIAARQFSRDGNVIGSTAIIFAIAAVLLLPLLASGDLGWVATPAGDRHGASSRGARYRGCLPPLCRRSAIDTVDHGDHAQSRRTHDGGAAWCHRSWRAAHAAGLDRVRSCPRCADRGRNRRKIQSVRPISDPGELTTVSPMKSHFVDVDGPTHYQEIGSEGSVLILVHGIGASLSLLVSRCRDAGAHHRVLALDLIGFGFTPPHGRPATRSNATHSS